MKTYEDTTFTHAGFPLPVRDDASVEECFMVGHVNLLLRGMLMPDARPMGYAEIHAFRDVVREVLSAAYADRAYICLMRRHYEPGFSHKMKVSEEFLGKGNA